GRVGRRAAVPQQQRTGVPVGGRLLFLGGLVDRAVLVQAHVAVRVHQPRHDPPRGPDLRTRDHVVGDPPVHHAELADLAVGEHRAGERQHANARYSPTFLQLWGTQTCRNVWDYPGGGSAGETEPVAVERVVVRV